MHDNDPIIIEDDYPTTVDLGGGRQLRIRVKRFDLDEYTAFIRDFNRCALIGKKDELLLARHRHEGEKLEDVLARLELEQSEDERAARAKRDADEESFATRFLTSSIQKFITVEPGQLYRASNRQQSLTTGDEFLRTFAAQQAVLQSALQAIYVENCISEAIKGKLKALSGSARISTESTPTAHGDAPAPTADAASPSDSVMHEAATVAIQARSSGLTTD